MSPNIIYNFAVALGVAFALQIYLQCWDDHGKQA